MSAFTIPGWSDQQWIMDPVVQPGPLVRIICPALRQPDGKPTWAWIKRDRLHSTPAARTTDPITSHEAAAMQTPDKVTNSHRLVMALLFEHGPMTDFDLADRASRASQVKVKQTSIGVRRAELVRLGLVVDSGFKGKSDTGARAIRWALTDSGRKEIGA